MHLTHLNRRGSVGLLLGALMTPAMATPAFAQNAGGAPEKDRRAILAMAGDFRVRFDFRETVPFVAGYTPIKPSVTLGTEIVRVIEDRGGLIRLQHILAMDDKEKPIVIKHGSPSQVDPDKAVDLAGKVDDPEGRVKTVRLYYRTGTKGDFNETEAERTPESIKMRIPADAVKPPLLEYYIVAYDFIGKSRDVFASAKKPQRIGIEEASEPPAVDPPYQPPPPPPPHAASATASRPAAAPVQARFNIALSLLFDWRLGAAAVDFAP